MQAPEGLASPHFCQETAERRLPHSFQAGGVDGAHDHFVQDLLLVPGAASSKPLKKVFELSSDDFTKPFPS